MIKTNFGRRLRELRKQSGKTLHDVAEALGVSVAHVSGVERGHQTPFGTEQIELLAALLDTEPSELHSLAGVDTRESMRHPTQPAGYDGKGVIRFKQNAIVRHLVDKVGISDLTGCDDDWRQLYQLIGYSVSGCPCMTDVDHEVVARMAQGDSEKDARIAALEARISEIEEAMRPAVCAVFSIDPEDLVKR